MLNTGLVRNIRHPPQPSTPALISGKLLSSAITIAHIAIGAVYLQDCPRNHYIPIYLIVAGVFGLVLTGLSLLPCARHDNDEGPAALNRVCNTWNTLTSVFLFCWFITGNVWVYSVYKPDFKKNATNLDRYCNKTLYLFAFWNITLFYILLLGAVLCGCCVLVCRWMCGHADADDV